MDHIPLPQNPLRPAFKVPLLRDQRWRYDRKGLEGFPWRYGFQTDGLQRGILKRGTSAGWETLTLVEILSFLQTWMFFGLIDEFFKLAFLRFNESEFILEQDGKQYLTTEKLPIFLEMWTFALLDAEYGNRSPDEIQI